MVSGAREMVQALEIDRVTWASIQEVLRSWETYGRASWKP